MTTTFRTLVARLIFCALAAIVLYLVYNGVHLWLIVPLWFVAGLFSHLLYPQSPMVERGMERTPRFRFWMSFCFGIWSLFVLAVGEDFEIAPGQKV